MRSRNSPVDWRKMDFKCWCRRSSIARTNGRAIRASGTRISHIASGFTARLTRWAGTLSATKFKRCWPRWIGLQRRSHADEKTKIGVVGYGEGGLIAFYAAACDPRIDACLVSGYFQQRSKPWEEPLDRNVWGLLRKFGDAEIASLIAPRSLTIEYSEVPKVEEPLPVRPGRKKSGAVGRLETPDFVSVEREVLRIKELLPDLHRSVSLSSDPIGMTAGPGSEDAMQRFAKALTSHRPHVLEQHSIGDSRRKFDPRSPAAASAGARTSCAALLREADATRDEQFLGKPEFKTRLGRRIRQRSRRRTEKKLWDEQFGRLDDQPLRAQSPFAKDLRPAQLDRLRRGARRVSRRLRLGRAAAPQGYEAGRAAPRRRLPAWPQRRAARTRSKGTCRPIMISPPGWPIADSSSSRRITRIAARTATGSCRARPIRSRFAVLVHPGTA